MNYFLKVSKGEAALNLCPAPEPEETSYETKTLICLSNVELLLKITHRSFLH